MASGWRTKVPRQNRSHRLPAWNRRRIPSTHRQACRDNGRAGDDSQRYSTAYHFVVGADIRLDADIPENLRVPHGSR